MKKIATTVLVESILSGMDTWNDLSGLIYVLPL